MLRSLSRFTQALSRFLYRRNYFLLLIGRRKDRMDIVEILIRKILQPHGHSVRTASVNRFIHVGVVQKLKIFRGKYPPWGKYTIVKGHYPPESRRKENPQVCLEPVQDQVTRENHFPIFIT